MTNSITTNVIMYKGIPCSIITVNGVPVLWDINLDAFYDPNNYEEKYEMYEDDYVDDMIDQYIEWQIEIDRGK